jgi:transposase
VWRTYRRCQAKAVLVSSQHDLRVLFGNNEAEQVIRMSKLRIKLSGCMRFMTGAQIFCAVRSYLTAVSRHGISWLDVVTHAVRGQPWIPGTT